MTGNQRIPLANVHLGNPGFSPPTKMIMKNSIKHKLRRLLFRASRRRGQQGTRGHGAGEKFYWQLSHIFHSVLGDGLVSITMAPDETGMVTITHAESRLQVKLSFQRCGGIQISYLLNGSWLCGGKFLDRNAAILKSLRISVATIRSWDKRKGKCESGKRASWVPLINGQRVPKLLRVGDQWTSSLHRSGWGYALEPLHSLHDKSGVVFDGFLESTFCWKDSGVRYREPWVGVIHNPPATPEWANNGKATNQYMFDTQRWRDSERKCKGIFVLSSYHRHALAGKLDVPVSVIRHPTELPQKEFSMNLWKRNRERKIIQIGHWLRNPNSLYKLRTRITKARLDVGHPWEESVRKNFAPESLDIGSVQVIPRVSNGKYDELLSANIVFLDLIDSSANNVIVECIVRNTPVLVNRHPAIIEYLGENYPFYFSDLEEAGRKACDHQLIEQAHQYLAAIPNEQFSQESFLQSVIQSTVYQTLLKDAVPHVSPSSLSLEKLTLGTQFNTQRSA